MHHRVADAPAAGRTTFTFTRPTLIGLVTGDLDMGTAIAEGQVQVDGDVGALSSLVGLLAPGDPSFAIVTP
jgi:alkyl sulfatase BDS1-like metallo-beta-lactamase superfamily hydrolase